MTAGAGSDPREREPGRPDAGRRPAEPVARAGGEPGAPGSRDELLERYSSSRRTDAGASSYATKYDREVHKRVSSFFERRVVRRALARTGLRGGARVLDLPCGAGRLSPLLRPVASLLVSADYSPAMVRQLRGARPDAPALVADCFHLPFRERAFDLVFSASLSHHIADDALRAEYLREVLRVAGRFAIVTFFDTASLKNLLRRARRWLDGKRPKSAFSRRDVERLAAERGFEVKAAYPLSRLASGHVFYVLARRG